MKLKSILYTTLIASLITGCAQNPKEKEATAPVSASTNILGISYPVVNPGLISNRQGKCSRCRLGKTGLNEEISHDQECRRYLGSNLRSASARFPLLFPGDRRVFRSRSFQRIVLRMWPDVKRHCKFLKKEWDYYLPQHVPHGEIRIKIPLETWKKLFSIVLLRRYSSFRRKILF